MTYRFAMASLLFFAASFPAFGDGFRFTSCNGCNTSAARAAAISAADEVDGPVYVMDSANEIVKKFGITFHIEPGSYSVTALSQTVEPSMLSISEDTWDFIDAVKSFDIPPGTSPSLFDFIENFNDRSMTINHLNSSGTFSFLQSITSYVMVSTASYLQSTGLSAPQIVTLDFSDGTTVKILVEIGIEIDTGQLQIIAWEYVDGSGQGEGVAIPLRREDFNGYDSTFLPGAFVDRLADLARLWGIPVTSAYGLVRAISCSATECIEEVL